MKTYRADVTVLPKDGVLDIQGKAVEKTLSRHGYESVREVRVGKFIRVTVEAEDDAEAGERVKAMAEDLLVNDLVESYSFALEPWR
ncbi:MAG: phosphoribosylformylglycinamidine synthase subunit PurS [Synergistaceae bacterium]|jgi:phosphoribosylformylglycinamidine synthase PurS subunit|nr:phosphoribosylformylglycinamidine synthase subunit PurS [Synergistaceae bacterium]